MDGGGRDWGSQGWNRPAWPPPPNAPPPSRPIQPPVATWRPPVPPQLTPNQHYDPSQYRPRHFAGGPPPRGPRRGTLLVVLVVLVVVACAGAGALVVTSDDGEDQAAATTVPEPTTPEEIFEAAAASLDDAGSFSYHFVGRWEFEDTVEGGTEVVTEDGSGAVSFPDEARHTVDANNGSRRMVVVDGSSTWERFSAFPDQIEQRPWSEIDARFGERGFNPAVLVDWLEAGRNHRDGGQDSTGHAVVHGELSPGIVPANALDLIGTEDETLTSELALTVDDDFAPLQVVVNATTQSAVVELTMDRIELGGVTTIEAPTDDMLDATPFVYEEDIVAVQGEPLGLTGLPDGWILANAMVDPDLEDPACNRVTYSYYGLGGDIDPETGPSDYLYLATSPMDCQEDLSWTEDTNFEAGDHSGFATEDGESTFGILDVGDHALAFDSSMSLADLEAVLATFGPVDFAAEPEIIEGLPGEPA